MEREKKDSEVSKDENDDRDRLPSLKPGYWTWDEAAHGIVFILSTEKEKPQALEPTTAVSVSSIAQVKDTTFKYTFGSAAIAKFSKYCERKAKPGAPNVVILQDCKDVALYSCEVKLLSPEFIMLFHSKVIDRFLRSLIVYFQYYLQIWNKLHFRRVEAARKLRQPSVAIWENNLRDDLADLRSMVARDYASILIGVDDASKFHHMKGENNLSLSDKDRRRFEFLFKMSIRVVWIALKKRHLSLIEKELDKLIRTINFSPSEHNEVKRELYVALPGEEQILRGKAFREEQKLLHRSPCIQELIRQDHDYRLLAIGITDVEDHVERINYLEIAYTAPEELLQDLNVGVGILGVPRKFLDPLLNEELQSTKKRSSIMKVIPDFAIPPVTPYDQSKIQDTLRMRPCRYQESEAAANARIDQCNMWLDYVRGQGQFSRGGSSVSRTEKQSIYSKRHSKKN